MGTLLQQINNRQQTIYLKQQFRMDPDKLIKIRKEYKQLLTSHQVNSSQAEQIIATVKNDIYALAQILDISEKILTDQKISQLYKINCLVFIRLLIETSECIPVIIIEVYFLQHIERIAISGSQASNYGYYQDLGYTQTQVTERYQKLSAQIIKIASAVKPYRMYQCLELSEPSQFSKSVQKINTYTSESLILDKSLSEMYNKNFLTSSKGFQEGNPACEEFTRYYSQKAMQFIECGPKALVSVKDGRPTEKCNLRSMLKYGSYHINFEVLSLCVQVLENSADISHRINSLHLISQMVNWGDIEALLLINYSDLIQTIANEIYLQKRSYRIFKDCTNQHEQRQKFLINFLKSIEIWAQCNPYDNLLNKESTDPSKIVKIYRKLKALSNPPLIFPSNPFVKTILNEFNTNIANNQQINDRILEDMHYQSMSIQGKVSSSSANRSDTILYLSLKERTYNVINHLKNIDKISGTYSLTSEQQALLQKQMFQLDKQANKIKRDAEILVDNETSLNPQNLAVLQNSSECIDMISDLCKNYRSYKKKEITFQILKNIVREDRKKLQEMRRIQEPFEETNSSASIDSVKNFIHKKIKGIRVSQSINSVSFGNSKFVRTSLPAQGNSLASIQKLKSPFNKNDQTVKEIQISDDLQLSESEIIKKSADKKYRSSSSSNLFNFSNNQLSRDPEHLNETNKQTISEFAEISGNINSELLTMSSRNKRRGFEIVSNTTFKIKSASPHSRFHKKSRTKTVHQSKLTYGDSQKVLKEQQSSGVFRQYFANSETENNQSSNLRKLSRNDSKKLQNAAHCQAEPSRVSNKNLKSEVSVKEKIEENYIFGVQKPEVKQQRESNGERSSNKRKIFGRQRSSCSKNSQDSSRSGRKRIFSRKSSALENKEQETSNFILTNTEIDQKNSKLASNENHNNLNKVGMFPNQYYQKSGAQSNPSVLKSKNQESGISLGHLPNVKTSLDLIPSDSGRSTPYKEFISHQTVISQINEISKYQAKMKKKLLKKRNLIIKNDDLEIGSITSKHNTNEIIVSYYITPLKLIQYFNSEFTSPDELNISVQGKQQKNLKVGKQYRVDFIIKMLFYKYRLPQIKFNYKADDSPKSSSLKTLLPVPSTRFLDLQKMSEEILVKEFSDENKEHEYPRLCTQIIPIQASLLKKDESLLFKYLQLHKFKTLSNGTQFFGGRCSFKSFNFLLKVVLKKNELLCFQGIAKQKESQKFMLHSLCELEKLFEGEVL